MPYGSIHLHAAEIEFFTADLQLIVPSLNDIWCMDFRDAAGNPIPETSSANMYDGDLSTFFESDGFVTPGSYPPNPTFPSGIQYNITQQSCWVVLPEGSRVTYIRFWNRQDPTDCCLDEKTSMFFFDVSPSL